MVNLSQNGSSTAKLSKEAYRNGKVEYIPVGMHHDTYVRGLVEGACDFR